MTHIAPADPDGTIIGEPVLQEGVIGIPSHSHATPTPLPRHSHDTPTTWVQTCPCRGDRRAVRDDDGGVLPPTLPEADPVTRPATRRRHVGDTSPQVYPDSPKADADICNRAQVAAITSALDFLLAERRAAGGAGGAAAKAEL